ncbi:serine/threonine protein kinase [Gordonia malaquae]|uniref:serine/threonine protein kinase n=1 Tax=Gordonia malaquae TaxID=410332 RepID=UPI0030176B65
MTTSSISTMRAWPVSALAVWAAARDAGRCAPDDVLHTLHDYAQAHEVDGPSDDVHTGDVLELLDLVAANAHVAVRMPAAGDAQGLPPGTVTDSAMTTGEILLIDDRPAGSDGPALALGLIARGTPERCRWELSRLTTAVAVDRLSSDLPLGELEYDLREAVGEAAQIIAGLSGARPSTPADLRDALAAMTEARRLDLPPHDNPRVDRVLAAAAQIDAIVQLAGVGTLGVSGAQSTVADDRLRRLTSLTRTARTAAINTLITDYRR